MSAPKRRKGNARKRRSVSAPQQPNARGSRRNSAKKSAESPRRRRNRRSSGNGKLKSSTRKRKRSRAPNNKASKRLGKLPRRLCRHWSEMTCARQAHLLAVMRSSWRLPRRSMISHAALCECSSHARRSSVEINPVLYSIPAGLRHWNRSTVTRRR